MYNLESFELSPASFASPVPLHLSESTYKSSLPLPHPRLSKCTIRRSFGGPNSFAYHPYEKTRGVGWLQTYQRPSSRICAVPLSYILYISDFAYPHSFQLIPRSSNKNTRVGGPANTSRGKASPPLHGFPCLSYTLLMTVIRGPRT